MLSSPGKLESVALNRMTSGVTVLQYLTGCMDSFFSYLAEVSDAELNLDYFVYSLAQDEDVNDSSYRRRSVEKFNHIAGFIALMRMVVLSLNNSNTTKVVGADDVVPAFMSILNNTNCDSKKYEIILKHLNKLCILDSYGKLSCEFVSLQGWLAEKLDEKRSEDKLTAQLAIPSVLEAAYVSKPDDFVGIQEKLNGDQIIACLAELEEKNINWDFNHWPEFSLEEWGLVRKALNETKHKNSTLMKLCIAVNERYNIETLNHDQIHHLGPDYVEFTTALADLIQYGANLGNYGARQQVMTLALGLSEATGELLTNKNLPAFNQKVRNLFNAASETMTTPRLKCGDHISQIGMMLRNICAWIKWLVSPSTPSFFAAPSPWKAYRTTTGQKAMDVGKKLENLKNSVVHIARG